MIPRRAASRRLHKSTPDEIANALAGNGKRGLIVWGASGHALVVADIVRAKGEYNIIGFIDDIHPERHGTEFLGAPVFDGIERLKPFHGMGMTDVIVAVGECEARLRLSNVARDGGFSLATAVHPGAVVAEGVLLGPGTVVAAGAVVNPGCVIGENVIVNTNSSIDHESVIGEGAHICPGAHLAGNVRVGRAAWIGIGATVIQTVRIGSGAVIGAGAVVLHDVPDNVVAYGVPARVVRGIGA